MKYKGLWLTLGFLLITGGLTAIFLQMLGIHWFLLAPLEYLGPLGAFVAKILMSLAGFIIVVIAHTDWDRERRDSEGLKN